jgi:anti-anti-sigma factor
MTIAELPPRSRPAVEAVVVARTIWPANVRIVVWLEGEQDASTAAGLSARLARAAATGAGDVVIDLRAVRFMDGAIVTVLVACKRLLAIESRRLTLRAPSPSAQHLLDLCGLIELVEPNPAAPSRAVSA